MDSILDSKRVERIMEIYEAEFFLSKSEYDMPFRKLEYSWHILEDGEVEKYLEETMDGQIGFLIIWKKTDRTFIGATVF